MVKKVVIDKIPEIVEKHTNQNTFSWASVFDVLLRNEGLVDISHEDVVMASGEGFAFAYSPYHYMPMYLGLMGSGVRVRNKFGYSIIWLQGPSRGGDVDKAWEFITTNLDKGHGIHVEGPESFIIYGYKDDKKKEDRELKCIAKWGSGLDGDIKWKDFIKVPVIFSLSTLIKTNPPINEKKNNHLLINQIHKYQSKHRGVGIKYLVHPEVKIDDKMGKELRIEQDDYGIKAFERFINDIQDEEMLTGMLQAYLYCHAMNFHLWGRQWQSKWFKKQAKMYEGKVAELFKEIADAYHKTAKYLEMFVEINAKNHEEKKLHENILEVIPSIKNAYKNEKKAIETIAKLVKALESKEPISLKETVQEALYSGMGAGDTHINQFSALEGLTEEILHKKPADNIMSIWEQLTHLQFWQELTLKNLKEGKPHWSDVDWSEYPPDYEALYGDWKTFHRVILDTFIEIQQLVMEENDLAKRYPEIDNVSFIQLVRFLCSHMSYHIGQVVMTRKLFDDWPPLGNVTSYHLIGP
ncbi:MAG: DinB family protein [Candidatus Heimdallarchaeota archaeon]